MTADPAGSPGPAAAPALCRVAAYGSLGSVQACVWAWLPRGRPLRTSSLHFRAGAPPPPGPGGRGGDPAAAGTEP